MVHTCKNCAHKFSGKYCSECGQPSDTQRLAIHYVWYDLQYNFIHFEKGLLYTLRQLFTRPGNSIREFIEGKRVQHIKPFSFLLLMAGVYGFLYHYLKINPISPFLNKDFNSEYQIEVINNWLSENYAIAELIYLPLISFSSWLVFKKYKYNYVEHLVLNAFLFGERIFLGILLLPFLSIYNGTSKMAIPMLIKSVLDILVIVWAYLQFFNKEKKSILIGKIALAFLLFLIIISILNVFGAEIIVGMGKALSKKSH